MKKRLKNQQPLTIINQRILIECDEDNDDNNNDNDDLAVVANNIGVKEEERMKPNASGLVAEIH